MLTQHLEAYEPVIMHSTQALKVDQENAKAFYRRGLAQEALGKTQARERGHGDWMGFSFWPADIVV